MHFAQIVDISENHTKFLSFNEALVLLDWQKFSDKKKRKLFCTEKPSDS